MEQHTDELEKHRLAVNANYTGFFFCISTECREAYSMFITGAKTGSRVIRSGRRQRECEHEKCHHVERRPTGKTKTTTTTNKNTQTNSRFLYGNCCLHHHIEFIKQPHTYMPYYRPGTNEHVGRVGGFSGGGGICTFSKAFQQRRHTPTHTRTLQLLIISVTR